MTSAPAATRSFATSAWFSATAHIRAVSPRYLSCGVHIGAAGQQGLDPYCAAGAGGGHQRSFAFAEGSVDVGPGFDQSFDHRAIAAVGGFGQRGDFIAVGGFGIGAGGEQRLTASRSSLCAAQIRGGHAVDVGGVHVQLLLEERAQRGAVLILGGLEQAEVAAKRAKTATAETEAMPTRISHVVVRHA